MPRQAANEQQLRIMPATRHREREKGAVPPPGIAPRYRPLLPPVSFTAHIGNFVQIESALNDLGGRCIRPRFRFTR
jgi:hypothetical protein